MSLISRTLRKIKRLFKYRPKCLKRRVDGMKYAAAVIDIILTYPNRGHFVGCRTINDCEAFAEMLFVNGVQRVKIASMGPSRRSTQVSYHEGVNLVHAGDANVLIGVTQALLGGWRSDGARNSIHCLHEIRVEDQLIQYLGRMRVRRGCYGYTSSLTNYVNGKFQ